MVQFQCGKGGSKKPHKALKKTSVSIEQSKFIFEKDNMFIPVNSGICEKCRTELLQRMEATKDSTIMAQKMYSEVEMDAESSVSFLDEARSEQPNKGQVLMDSQGEDEFSVTETASSQFSLNSEWKDSQERPSRKRKAALNEFLAAVDISPIKKL